MPTRGDVKVRGLSTPILLHARSAGVLPIRGGHLRSRTCADPQLRHARVQAPTQPTTTYAALDPEAFASAAVANSSNSLPPASGSISPTGGGQRCTPRMCRW